MRRNVLYDLRSLKVSLDLMSREAAKDHDMQTAYWLDLAKCLVASAYTRVECQQTPRLPLTTGRPVESEAADA